MVDDALSEIRDIGGSVAALTDRIGAYLDESDAAAQEERETAARERAEMRDAIKAFARQRLLWAFVTIALALGAFSAGVTVGMMAAGG